MFQMGWFMDQLKKGYVRVPHEEIVDLDFSMSEYIDQNRELDDTKAKITELKKRNKQQNNNTWRT